MLLAVRGGCCSSSRLSLPSLRVHELKPSRSIRGSLGHAPLHSSLPGAKQHRRVFVTRNSRLRCDTSSPAAALSDFISRPSLALLPFSAMSATRVQQRGHAGHSHHHHHDNTYLTSSNKNDAAVRITRIGLYVNLCMAIGKGLGGYVFHSQGTSTYGSLDMHI
jgi:hypothetical protein